MKNTATGSLTVDPELINAETNLLEAKRVASRAMRASRHSGSVRADLEYTVRLITDAIADMRKANQKAAA